MSQRRNTQSPSSRARYTMAAALVLAGLAACSADQVTAPEAAAPTAAASAALIGQTATQMTPFSSLSLSSATFETYRTSWRTASTDMFAATKKPRRFSCSGVSTAQGRGTIGTGGGTIAVGNHRFVVPSGALSASTAITVSFSKSGKGVEVDAWPHGLKFAKPVEFQFDLSGCSVPSGSTLNVYYVNDYDYVTQVMPSTTASGRTRALTDHFSGFVVAWGVM